MDLWNTILKEQKKRKMETRNIRKPLDSITRMAL